jgi:hypothetical protein
MKKLCASLLCTAAALSGWAGPAHAVEDDTFMLAFCASLGLAVVAKPDGIPPEVKKLTTYFIFLPATVKPPPFHEPTYKEGQRAAQEAFVSTSGAPRDQEIEQALRRCMPWVESFIKKLPN